MTAIRGLAILMLLRLATAVGAAKPVSVVQASPFPLGRVVLLDSPGC